MLEIKLNPRLFPFVINGEKKATTRLGEKNYELGEALLAHPENVDLQSVKVYIHKLEILTKEGLKRNKIHEEEGYSNFDTFWRVLESYYPGINWDSVFTTAHFRYIGG